MEHKVKMPCSYTNLLYIIASFYFEVAQPPFPRKNCCMLLLNGTRAGKKMTLLEVMNTSEAYSTSKAPSIRSDDHN